MKRYAILFMSSGMLFAACNNQNTQPAAGPATAGEPTKAEAPAVARPKLPEAKGTPRILFVGNSHTECFVSMPILFDELCKASKQPMKVEKMVTMGVALDEVYADNKAAADKNFEKTDADGNYYDIVVLQEKTTVALQELEQYKTNVKMLADKIRKNSPGAAIYVYEGMSPLPYTDADYDKYFQEMRKNAAAVAQENHAGLFRVGDAVKDAYAGKSGYQYKDAAKDRLRFGSSTLHLLNDGGYLETVLLYATLFDKMPVVPAALTLSTGTGDNDPMKLQPVAKTISNTKALEDIASADR